MRKIKLDLETIEVESFKTDAAEGEDRGTVHGHFTRKWEQSCYESCTNIADCLCLSEFDQCGTEP